MLVCSPDLKKYPLPPFNDHQFACRVRTVCVPTYAHVQSILPDRRCSLTLVSALRSHTSAIFSSWPLTQRWRLAAPTLDAADIHTPAECIFERSGITVGEREFQTWAWRGMRREAALDEESHALLRPYFVVHQDEAFSRLGDFAINVTPHSDHR